MTNMLSVVKSVGVGLFGFAVLDSFCQVLIFSGTSMEPTIHDRDVGLGLKILSYESLRRGDIVTAVAPDDPSMMICKRIVALEGDKVTYSPPGSQSLAQEEDSGVVLLNQDETLGVNFVYASDVSLYVACCGHRPASNSAYYKDPQMACTMRL